MKQSTQNLITLRDKVFPVVFEMDKRGRVDLNQFNSECGTYKCLRGWHDTIVFGYAARGVRSKSHPYNRCKYFTISKIDWLKLFGSATHGTLQDRYNYLCNLIEQRLKEEGEIEHKLPERNFAAECEAMLETGVMV